MDIYKVNAWKDTARTQGFNGATPLFPPGAMHSPARTMWGLFNDISVLKPYSDPPHTFQQWSLHKHPYLFYRHLYDEKSPPMVKDRIVYESAYANMLNQLMPQLARDLAEHCLKNNLSLQDMIKSQIPRVFPHDLKPIILQHTQNYNSHLVYNLQNHRRVKDQISFMMRSPEVAVDPRSKQVTAEYTQLERVAEELKRQPRLIQTQNFEYLQPITHTPFITPLPLFHPIVPLPNLTTLVNIQARAPWAFLGTSLPATIKHAYCNPYLPDEAKDLPKTSLDKFQFDPAGIAIGDYVSDYEAF